jgi:hypothetical protein
MGRVGATMQWCSSPEQSLDTHCPRTNVICDASAMALVTESSRFSEYSLKEQHKSMAIEFKFYPCKWGFSPPGRGNDLCNRENVLKQLLSSPLDHDLELLLHRLQVLPVQFHFLIALPGNRFQSSHPLLVFGQALRPLSVHVTQLPC